MIYIHECIGLINDYDTLIDAMKACNSSGPSFPAEALADGSTGDYDLYRYLLEFEKRLLCPIQRWQEINASLPFNFTKGCWKWHRSTYR